MSFGTNDTPVAGVGPGLRTYTFAMVAGGVFALKILQYRLWSLLPLATWWPYELPVTMHILFVGIMIGANFVSEKCRSPTVLLSILSLLSFVATFCGVICSSPHGLQYKIAGADATKDEEASPYSAARYHYWTRLMAFQMLVSLFHVCEFFWAICVHHDGTRREPQTTPPGTGDDVDETETQRAGAGVKKNGDQPVPVDPPCFRSFLLNPVEFHGYTIAMLLAIYEYHLWKFFIPAVRTWWRIEMLGNVSLNSDPSKMSSPGTSPVEALLVPLVAFLCWPFNKGDVLLSGTPTIPDPVAVPNLRVTHTPVGSGNSFLDFFIEDEEVAVPDTEGFYQMNDTYRTEGGDGSLGVLGRAKIRQLVFRIAVSFCFLGLCLRTVGLWTAGRNFTHEIREHRESTHKLVTHGVYALCRHPGYVGWFIWAVSSQMVLFNLFSSVGYIWVSWIFFRSRIRYEESLLVRFFGDAYLVYAKQVPCGFPYMSQLDLSDVHCRKLGESLPEGAELICQSEFERTTTAGARTAKPRAMQKDVKNQKPGGEPDQDQEQDLDPDEVAFAERHADQEFASLFRRRMMQQAGLTGVADD